MINNLMMNKEILAKRLADMDTYWCNRLVSVKNGDNSDCSNKDCDECAREFLDWLMEPSEYELLKSAHILDAGDIIQVLRDDQWIEAKFLFFLDGKFYVAKIGEPINNEGSYESYKYARKLDRERRYKCY